MTCCASVVVKCERRVLAMKSRKCCCVSMTVSTGMSSHRHTTSSRQTPWSNPAVSSSGRRRYCVACVSGSCLNSVSGCETPGRAALETGRFDVSVFHRMWRHSPRTVRCWDARAVLANGPPRPDHLSSARSLSARKSRVYEVAFDPTELTRQMTAGTTH